MTHTKHNKLIKVTMLILVDSETENRIEKSRKDTIVPWKPINSVVCIPHSYSTRLHFGLVLNGISPGRASLQHVFSALLNVIIPPHAHKQHPYGISYNYQIRIHSGI